MDSLHDIEREDSREIRQFERLTFFSDAVFAIAITLLVLDLKPPTSTFNTQALKAMIPSFEGFGISFFVIAVYWLAHHELFGTLRREDRALRVMNFLFLASIAFLPFPTSVIALYPATTAPVIFYALSVAAVGLLLVGLTLTARRPALTRPGEIRAETHFMIVRSLVAPMIFLVSAGVAIRSPHAATYMWILIWPGLRCVDLWPRLARSRGDERLAPAKSPP
jgi:uncharacterized membrane protein